jgi:CubicO group peptidase (beta-lactamase class C family)
MRRETWLLILALLVPWSAAAVPADIGSRVQAIVDEQRARTQTPGAAVVVVADGRVVARVGSGWADREAGREATAQTVFPAASVSKLLTATLVMRAVERGKLELDAPANRYLPPERWIRDTRGDPVPATVRQLLNHSSGLPVAFESATVPAPDGGLRTLSEYLAEGLETERPPGEKLVYANEAFALAGYLAAQAAGREFDELAGHDLFEPLAMPDSSFAHRADLDARLAVPYGGFAGGDEPGEQMDVTAIGPAGSLRTTADDLARFALMQLGEGALDGARILRPESVREMMRLQARQHPELDEGFGLGFGVLDHPERRVVWWDGGLPGVATRLMLWPDLGVGVVVLTNRADPVLCDEISRRVIDLIAGPVEVSQLEPDVASAAEITGQYRLLDVLEESMWFMEPFAVLQLEVRDGRPGIGLALGETRYPLHPIGPRRFRIEGGLVDGATVYLEGDRLYAGFVEARRLAPWETTTALLAYAGLAVLVLLFSLGWTGLRVVRFVRAT